MDNENLLIYERYYWNKGFEYIAGIDEAGRGPLAGPVVSACVIFPKNFFLEGVDDSKKLSSKKRESLFEKIINSCLDYSITIIDNNEIDRINIYEATKLAMIRSVEKLKIKPDVILVDAMPLKLDYECVPIIKGDEKSFTIAAASILAKVFRDNLMLSLDKEYPVYNWKKNKGYPTREHKESIRKHGYSPYHRLTFKI